MNFAPQKALYRRELAGFGSPRSSAMRLFPPKLSPPNPPFSCSASIPPPSLGCSMDERIVLPISLKWSLSSTYLDASACAFSRARYSSVLRVGFFAFETQLATDSPENQTEEHWHEDVDIFNDDAGFRESERRRKIGLANKGKVPWNIGRKHSEETRERIRRRTIEALRDPKVRKKMAEHPRPHSDQIKAKIRTSLRRIWGERLKEKRSKEKFYLSWSEKIAETARKGLPGQEELEWDAFDRIKRELVLQQLKRMVEKDVAKIIAKVRAVRAAAAKAEKLARLARKRKEREEKRKEKEENQKKAMLRKLEENKDECEVTHLKQRLEKIQRKKPVTIQVNGQRNATSLYHTPSWEKMDTELIRKEKERNGLSLADQIRAAKNRRAESTAREPASAYTSSVQ